MEICISKNKGFLFAVAFSNIAASQFLKNRGTHLKRIREEKLIHVTFVLVCCYFTFLLTVTPAQRYCRGFGGFLAELEKGLTFHQLYLSEEAETIDGTSISRQSFLNRSDLKRFKECHCAEVLLPPPLFWGHCHHKWILELNVHAFKSQVHYF